MTAHQVLGVQPFATQPEIQVAYRRLAKKYHPDQPGGDQAKFVLLGEAYQALKEGRTVLQSLMSPQERATAKAVAERALKFVKQQQEIVEARVKTWDPVSAAEIIRQMREPLAKERARLEAELAGLG